MMELRHRHDGSCRFVVANEFNMYLVKRNLVFVAEVC